MIETKENGWETRAIVSNCNLVQTTEWTKNTKRAKELGRVPCDWTKNNEEFLGFSLREVARGNQWTCYNAQTRDVD